MLLTTSSAVLNALSENPISLKHSLGVNFLILILLVSKTRRGRVQECGNISPTITATETGVCKIEYDDKIICASRGRNPENQGLFQSRQEPVQRRPSNPKAD